jgi:hypothetical protein
MHTPAPSPDDIMAARAAALAAARAWSKSTIKNLHNTNRDGMC